MKRRDHRGKPYSAGVGVGADQERQYTADEIEFMLAMDRYKRVKRRPFPTWSEVLEVLKGLGYHKHGSE